jgi:hypothetical protein
MYQRDGLILPLLLLFIAFSMIVISHILEVKIGWAIFAYAAGSSVLNPEAEEEMHQNVLIS